jgi:hypothetical protein
MILAPKHPRKVSRATVKIYPKASQQRTQSAHTDPNFNKGGFNFRFPPPKS